LVVKSAGRVSWKGVLCLSRNSEATRTTGAWSLDTTRKAQAPMFAPKSVGRMTGKAYFAFIRHSETPRGARRWSLDTKKCERRPFSCEKRWKNFVERRTLPFSNFWSVLNNWHLESGHY